MGDTVNVCPNCGAAVEAGDRFCNACGSGLESQPAPVSGSQPSVPVPQVSPHSVDETYPGADPPLQFDVEYPGSLSRWKIFVKWLLVIPHLFILSFLQFGMWIVGFVAWFAILFTGRYPRGLFDFSLMVLRWTANVNAYQWLQRDEYPPFGDGSYPVLFDLHYPDHLSRWKIFVKWLLLIPHYIALSLVGIVWFAVIIVAWFAILITGNMPRSLFDFTTGFSRWSYRVNAYFWLMTDRYPPFGLE